MEFLHLLENIRFPALDAFMLSITRLGEETAFLAIAILFFWCVDKYQGYYLMGVGLLGNMANQFLKILCRVPRPWIKDPSLTVVGNAKEAATGYSFPSGHSQTAVGTFGAIAVTQKKHWLQGICLAVMFLVPFSRLYLGVHTPADVLIGSGMAMAIILLLEPLMLGNGKKNIPWVFAALLVLSIGYLLYVELYPFGSGVDAHNYESALKNGYTFLGCFAGMLVVYFVDEKKLHFSTKAVWWAQILKAVLGLAVVLAVKEGTRGVLDTIFSGHLLSRAVRYFLVVTVAGILWPLTFHWFAKLGTKEN